MIARAAELETMIRDSPAREFGIVRKPIFSCEDTGAPFDLEHVVLPPGKRNFPHHSHATLWEMYYVISEKAVIRIDDDSHEVGEGDSVMCPPGMAHQIINESGIDVVYLVISNDPPFGCAYCPDSGKMLVGNKVWKGQPDEARGFWTKTDQTYYDGEE
jgi:uncharacterized cupin superfamily protein